MKSISVLY